MGDYHHKKVKCPVCGCAMKKSDTEIREFPHRSARTHTETYNHDCKGCRSFRVFQKYRDRWYCTDTYTIFTDPAGDLRVADFYNKTVDILKVIDRDTVNKLVKNARGLLKFIESGSKLKCTYQGKRININSLSVSEDEKTINIDFR